MVRYCPLCGPDHIGFGIGAAAGGSRVDPPIIQHLRNVHGLRRRVPPLHFVDDAQEKVVVLRAVTFRTLAAHSIEPFFFEHGKMADIVAGHQVFRRVIRLEMSHRGAADILFKQRFIAVRKRRTGFLQHFAHTVNRVRGQYIVVVCQRQIRPVGQSGGRIGVGCDPLILDLHIADTRVLRGPGTDHLSHLGVGLVGSIGQTKLPVGCGLALHAVQKCL